MSVVLFLGIGICYRGKVRPSGEPRKLEFLVNLYVVARPSVGNVRAPYSGD